MWERNLKEIGIAVRQIWIISRRPAARLSCRAALDSGYGRAEFSRDRRGKGQRGGRPARRGEIPGAPNGWLIRIPSFPFRAASPESAA